MILVRTVFQVKFGHMNAVLAIINEARERGLGSDRETMLLTDAGGQMFTLVSETKAESVDAYLTGLEASYSDPDAAAFMGKMSEHVESGRREYYNIEWQA